LGSEKKKMISEEREVENSPWKRIHDSDKKKRKFFEEMSKPSSDSKNGCYLRR
jgi:hypothetical protein